MEVAWVSFGSYDEIMASQKRSRRSSSFDAHVATDASDEVKIDAIRAGLEAGIVDSVVQYLNVPKTQVFGVIGVAESTAHRLIQQHRRLDSAASERVIRIADITRMAQEALGGREPAVQWLTTANRALGGGEPLSMLDTELGATAVRQVLLAIEWGGVL